MSQSTDTALQSLIHGPFERRHGAILAASYRLLDGLDYAAIRADPKPLVGFLTGAVLLIEAERVLGLGQVDRQLTQLIRAGALDGIAAIALGRFPGFEDFTDRGWNLVDVLRDRLLPLGIPVLGGLGFGHGSDPRAVPLGAVAELDSVAGTLTYEAPGSAPD